MKIMISANLGVGETPSVGIPSREVMVWQQERIKALTAAIDDARLHGAEACVVCGGVFADGFVPQSLVSEVVNVVTSCGLHVLYVPFAHEAEGLETRVDTSGFETVRPTPDYRSEVSVSAGNACIEIGFEEVDKLDIKDMRPPEGLLTVLRDDHDVTVVTPDGIWVPVGPLEPMSFADPLSSGYLLVEVAEDGACSHEWIDAALHPFVTRKVKLGGQTSTRELVTFVGNAVKDVSRDACLRIELGGRIPLDVYINTDELTAQFGKYFSYVEIVDSCSLDLDVAALDTDVSLLGEFVRQVSEDDSLSEREKVRILRCGWNALNGKELAE